MAELGERRQLLHGGADAAIPDEFAGRADADAHLAPLATCSAPRRITGGQRLPTARRRVPSQSSLAYGNPGRGVGRRAAAVQYGDVSTAASRRRLSTTTMCSRSSMSTPMWTGGSRQRRLGRREDRAADAARSCRAEPHRLARPGLAPWKLRFTGWAWAWFSR